MVFLSKPWQSLTCLLAVHIGVHSACLEQALASREHPTVRVGRQSAGKSPRPLHQGGFGFGLLGLAGGEIGDFRYDLLNNADLGLDEVPKAFGLHYGGGAYFLFGGHYLVGGHGFGLAVNSTSSATVDLGLRGGGGVLSAGYAIVNTGSYLIYPYLGAGGYGFTLEVNNRSEQKLRVGSRLLAPGTEQLTSGFFVLEVGVGVQRIFRRGKIALLSGLEVGVVVSPTAARWRSADGTRVGAFEDSRLGSSRLLLGYLRLVAGAGLFD